MTHRKNFRLDDELLPVREPAQPSNQRPEGLDGGLRLPHPGVAIVESDRVAKILSG
jgi:hypothetical protein